jgi:tetratricopeptide (TPR) repeat protein
MDRLEGVKEKQEQARSYRKKGDALRKIGREKAACEAYQAGVDTLKSVLQQLRAEPDPVVAMSMDLTAEQEIVLAELIETYGARGGMLLRLQSLQSLHKALRSYEKGAALEERFARPGTYNRLNAVKTSLLVGDKHLRDLEPQIRALAAHIESNMRENKALSDSGWAWADLGDCFALLGNTDDARKAYTTFIAKAEIKSPERTLDVLKEIATKLKDSRDPDAMRLQSAIDVLDSRLEEK